MTERMTAEKASVLNQIQKIKGIAEELDSNKSNPGRIQSLAASLHTACEALEIFANSLPTTYTSEQQQHT